MQGRQVVRVWVDDRHPIFRRGLVSCLSIEGYAVAGESAMLKPAPDFASVDVLVFEADRGGLARVLAATRDVTVRLVGLVASHDDPMVFDLIDRGVGAVLFRNELGPQALAAAIGSVVNGNSALPAELVPRLLDRAARTGAGGPHPLTDRELEVLRSCPRATTPARSPRTSAIRRSTVKNIVHDVLVRMNCRNRAQAVALATRQGLI